MTAVEPLSDTDYFRFLTDGYLVLTPDSLKPADHAHLYGQAQHLYVKADESDSPTVHLDYLGDHLRAQVPAINRVLHDPTVAGALERVLGADHLLHPHSFCHRSTEIDQAFHQDGNLPWNERGHYRSHRPDWAMLFYYPQAVDLRNGPTEVIVGSQYWTIDHETTERWHPGDRIDRRLSTHEMADPDLDARDERQRMALRQGLGVPDLDRRFLELPAGSVVLAHYDLIHRGSRSKGAPEPRYMYKFYFARLHRPAVGLEPVNPPALPEFASVAPRQRGVVRTMWRWSQGLDATANPDGDHQRPISQPELDEARRDLSGDREDKRTRAAYYLAEAGVLAPLAAALHSEAEGTRRAAAHGLRAIGAAAVPTLVAGLDSARPPVRRAAAAGLASDRAAGSETTAALGRRAASDPDDLVRSLAVYALGQLARHPGADGPTIMASLLDRLALGAEADNAHGAGFSRSIVRQSAAIAMVEVLVNHHAPTEVVQMLTDLLRDEPDRYVRGLLAEGLGRVGRVPETATTGTGSASNHA